MKIRNFIFSGFMASILMAGAAYAEEPAPTVDQSGFLTTKSYVDSAARWAKSKGEAAATTAKSEAIAAAAADATTKAGAVETKLNTHIADTEKHITAAERTAWNTAADLAESALQSADLTGYATESYVSGNYVAKEEGKGLISDADLEKIGQNESNLSGISAVVEEHTETISANTAAIATKASQSALDAEVTRATGAEAALDTRLDTAEATISEHTSSIAANAADIETNATNIATNAADIDTLEATVNDATTGLATKAAASDVTALGTRVTTAEGDIDALEGLVGTTAVATQISTAVAAEATIARAAEEALAGRVTTAEGDIDALEGLVGNTAVASQISTAVAAEAAIARAAEQENATDIATNAANIASINTQLGNFKCSGSACYIDNAGALQTFSSISSWTDLED